MQRAVYPGSFDPITNGHLDVIRRAARIFDEVVVAVACNRAKAPLFSADERLTLIREATADLKQVRVTHFDGLLIDFVRESDARVVIRGLRAISDFEFEFQMALTNRHLNPDIETIFLMPQEEYTYLSSSIVKEIARFNGDISKFVPTAVRNALAAKYSQPENPSTP